MVISFKELGNYGHMGNSLFQAACTIALAKRNNDTCLFPDTWKYKNSFNIPSNYFAHKNNIKPSFTYSESHFHYVPIVYRSGMNLHGYFQSWKYFNDFESNILQMFKPKHDIVHRPNVASIHVRRTDYLKFPNHHPVPGIDYYEKAMERVGVDKFLVFSDDIAWCKQHFIGNSFEFSEGKSDVADLALQAGCAHNICANSSFSWWAAYLNNNKNKVVIVPKTWFGPALSMNNTKDLCPNSWIKI